MLSGKLTDKLLFVAIYIAAGILVVYGARCITNYALDIRFYQDFLLPWKTTFLAMRHQAPIWPEANGEDPMGAMQTLVRHLQEKGIEFPKSNTTYPFVYRLNKFGERDQRILMVFRQNKMLLYGLPASSFNRLDRIIDGFSDAEHGDFTGRKSTDQISCIAQWIL